MKVIDTHCDALLRLQLAKNGSSYGVEPIDFRTSHEIETSLVRLEQGNVMAQFFAIFIEPEVPFDLKWQYALEQIDLFYTEILGKNKEMKHIRKWEDFHTLKDGEIGAVLTLEGADAFGDDLVKLRTLYRLGVLSMGMTWNYPNLCADGAGESRGGGLTDFGKEVVKLNNEHKVFTDVSHATVNGFWDILEHSDYPIASHSNARAKCDHVRNLYDDQIKEMFAKNGLIHVVFNPPFINEGERGGTLKDLINHIDHLCALGGEKQIGFGSDFDGIACYIDQLEHAGQFPNLINELLKHYSEDQVRGFASENFLRNLPK